MKDLKEIENFVDKSFLPKIKKDELLKYLQEKGDGEEFYKIFNEYLIKETDERSGKHEEVLNKYKEKCNLLENKLQNIKEKLELELENKLSDITDADFEKRKVIFDEYYLSLENAYKGHEKDLKEMSTTSLTETIKGILS